MQRGVSGLPGDAVSALTVEFHTVTSIKLLDGCKVAVPLACKWSVYHRIFGICDAQTISPRSRLLAVTTRASYTSSIVRIAEGALSPQVVAIGPDAAQRDSMAALKTLWSMEARDEAAAAAAMAVDGESGDWAGGGLDVSSIGVAAHVAGADEDAEATSLAFQPASYYTDTSSTWDLLSSAALDHILGVLTDYFARSGVASEEELSIAKQHLLLGGRQPEVDAIDAVVLYAAGAAEAQAVVEDDGMPLLGGAGAEG